MAHFRRKKSTRALRKCYLCGGKRHLLKKRGTMRAKQRDEKTMRDDARAT